MTAAARQPQPWKPTRLVATVSGTVGLCIVGDSLLYSILPLEAENFGFHVGTGRRVAKHQQVDPARVEQLDWRHLLALWATAAIYCIYPVGFGVDYLLRQRLGGSPSLPLAGRLGNCLVCPTTWRISSNLGRRFGHQRAPDGALLGADATWQCCECFHWWVPL